MIIVNLILLQNQLGGTKVNDKEESYLIFNNELFIEEKTKNSKQRNYYKEIIKGNIATSDGRSNNYKRLY